MPPDADATATPAIALYVALAIAPVVLILLIWIARKGRRLPGEYVFKASRLSRGNRLFPAQVVLTPSSITLFKPQWIGKVEESIHLSHVASIRIDTNLIFADLFVESSGGQDPIVCHGHTKGDAVKMKALIEEFQTRLYGDRTMRQ
jgi:hypothetical protein